MRLIDADALLKEANADGAYGYVDAWQIANAPTIEAELVRHGWWIESAGGRTICNQCGEYPLYDYFGRLKLSTVCPNCGARMEVGKPSR